MTMVFTILGVLLVSYGLTKAVVLLDGQKWRIFVRYAAQKVKVFVYGATFCGSRVLQLLQYHKDFGTR